MQQSNFIFAMLLIAFIVFITLKGELSAYISLLRGSGAGGAGGAGGSSGNPITDAFQAATGVTSSLSSSFDSALTQLQTNENSLSALTNQFNFGDNVTQQFLNFGN